MATKQELAEQLAVAKRELEALASSASVNAIANSAPLAPISPNDRLYNAAAATVTIDDELREAFIAAGGDQKGPKDIVMTARVAASLTSKRQRAAREEGVNDWHLIVVTREEALIILGKQGRGKRAPTEKLSDKFRTYEEEQACGAARGFLSARLKAWEIKTTEARGGARANDEDNTTCDATPFEKLRKPKVESAIEFGAFMLAHVNALYDFCVVNAEHPAIKDSDASAEIMGALADCLDVIKSAQAKNA